MPIHLIWGDKDTVTPLDGPVGNFYSDLTTSASRQTSDLVDVSMQVIRAGHIPFDERPECNEGLIQWLEQLTSPKVTKYQGQTTTLSFPKWPFNS